MKQITLDVCTSFNCKLKKCINRLVQIKQFGYIYQADETKGKLNKMQ